MKGVVGYSGFFNHFNQSLMFKNVKKANRQQQSLSDFQKFEVEKNKQHKLKGGNSETVVLPPTPNDFIVDVIVDL